MECSLRGCDSGGGSGACCATQHPLDEAPGCCSVWAADEKASWPGKGAQPYYSYAEKKQERRFVPTYKPYVQQLGWLLVELVLIACLHTFRMEAEAGTGAVRYSGVPIRAGVERLGQLIDWSLPLYLGGQSPFRYVVCTYFALGMFVLYLSARREASPTPWTALSYTLRLALLAGSLGTLLLPTEQWTSFKRAYIYSATRLRVGFLFMSWKAAAANWKVGGWRFVWFLLVLTCWPVIQGSLVKLCRLSQVPMTTQAGLGLLEFVFHHLLSACLDLVFLGHVEFNWYGWLTSLGAIFAAPSFILLLSKNGSKRADQVKALDSTLEEKDSQLPRQTSKASKQSGWPEHRDSAGIGGVFESGRVAGVADRKAACSSLNGGTEPAEVEPLPDKADPAARGEHVQGPCSDSGRRAAEIIASAKSSNSQASARRPKCYRARTGYVIFSVQVRK